MPRLLVTNWPSWAGKPWNSWGQVKSWGKAVAKTGRRLSPQPGNSKPGKHPRPPPTLRLTFQRNRMWPPVPECVGLMSLRECGRRRKA